MTALLMLFFGYAIVSRFFKESILEKIGHGFLIGFGLLTTLLFLFTYFHIRLNHTIISSVLIFFGLLSLFLLLTARRDLAKKNPPAVFTLNLSPLQWFFLSLIILSGLVSLVINWYWPVTAWDSITLYDFRAKLYAGGGLLVDLWENLSRDPEQLSYYYSYPPITSLAHTIGYLIKDYHTSLFYSFFYLSLIMLFYSSVSRKSSVSVGLVLTFLLATNFTIFSHSLLAYTNIPQTAYLVASFFTLEKFAESKKLQYFLLGVFFASMSVLIRASDLFPFLLFVIFIPLILEKRKYIKHLVVFVLATFLVRFFAFSHFNVDLSYLTPKMQVTDQLTPMIILKALLDFSKYPKVISYLYTSLAKYHLHLLLFLISFIFFSKPKASNSKIVAAFITLSLLVLIPGTLVLSVTYVGWDKVPDSVHRLMFFLYPLILYYLAGVHEVNVLFDSFSVKMKT